MSKKGYKSAEIVSTAEGKQYHIGLKPGDVAPNILMCGDPARAHRVASYFDSAKDPITSREYVTITGKYNGLPMTVMATGMGPDNTEIAFVELMQIVKNPTFIRIGSCSTLQKNILIGDVVISTGSVRLENTSTYFVVEGYPCIAHPEVVMAMTEAASAKNFKHHLGITAAAPGFYGAQCRNVPGFPPRFPNLLDDLAKMNVSNIEMESSCLFTLASLAGVRAGTVCAVYGSRTANKFIDPKTKDEAERKCLETGLVSFEVLDLMDMAKGRARYWKPSLGL